MPPTDPPLSKRSTHRRQPHPGEWRASEILVQLVSLMREFPHWAIWRTGSGEWSAVRIPVRGRSLPDQVLMWIHAKNSQELRTRIHAADAGA